MTDERMTLLDLQRREMRTQLSLGVPRVPALPETASGLRTPDQAGHGGRPASTRRPTCMSGIGANETEWGC